MPLGAEGVGQSQVGRGHRRRQHQSGLVETDHSDDAALDRLGRVVLQVAEEPLDATASSVGVVPLRRTEEVALMER